MNREPNPTGKPKPPIHLQRQIIVDVDGTQIIVNHHFTGTKTVREAYENFLERKLRNP